MLRFWVTFLALGAGLYAQHILYDPKQDQAAQDSVKAAKEITSGSLFDTMIRNLDQQSRQEMDTVLAYTRETMRAKLVAFTVWAPSERFPDEEIEGVPICRSLFCELNKLQTTLEAGSPLDPKVDKAAAAAQLAVIKTKSAALKMAVDNLQSAKKSDDPAVLAIFSHLGDAKELVGYAEKIAGLAGKTAPALGEISSGLDQAISLYGSVKSIWESEKAVEGDPNALRPPKEVVELQLLRLEEQHIKNLARIRAANKLEVGDVLRRLMAARQFLGPKKGANVLGSSEKIDDTLEAEARSPSRERLTSLLRGLLEAAAALAANDSAIRLEETREGQEERSYNILRSAVNSSVYDQTIQAAVERLAIYYKSGIKPSDLAALAFFITNSVAVPVIAAK